MDADVIIVGAGPVGLLLACLSAHSGLRCRVLERRRSPAAESRSIGVHPVTLEVLRTIDLADAFVAAGHRIERGHAFVAGRHAGSIDFRQCPPPFRFVLTLRQQRTERLLEEKLDELDPAALLRGAMVTNVDEDGDGVTAWYRDTPGGGAVPARARVLVGCDGVHSAVRAAAGIDVCGGAYPDFYLMAEFADSDPPDPDAAIHLHPHGVVESFPLPNGWRRWVVKVDRPRIVNSPQDVADLVLPRTGIDLTGRACRMTSAFGTQHAVAARFATRRLALAGDAAHVVSPIGGLGMNLGWLDAEHLARVLAAAREPSALARQLRVYDRARRSAARKAMRRAELNMRLGRAHAHPLVRYLVVRAMLASVLTSRTAELFTMRGLESRSSLDRPTSFG